jgi:hypothetical protein
MDTIAFQIVNGHVSFVIIVVNGKVAHSEMSIDQFLQVVKLTFETITHLHIE